MTISTKSIVFLAALLIWILGLALSWGGWIWVFFVIWLIAGGGIIIGRTGKGRGRRSGQSSGRRSSRRYKIKT